MDSPSCEWRAARRPQRVIATVSVLLLVLATTPGWLHLQLERPAPPAPQFRQIAWREVPELPRPLAQLETVFWEPRDTDSLRERILRSGSVRDKQVLEIGTGTGLLALCCCQAGASSVVATDVNAAAVANARYNAEQLGFTERLDVRLVSLSDPSAFSVIGPNEQFDLIVSNPPWEDSTPRSIAEFALYDPGFQLLDSLLRDGGRHLRPGGRMWLAYGCATAIRVILETAPRQGWQVRWLDERTFADLPEVFLPGLLLELTRDGSS